MALSPMMQQYLQTKENYKDAIVFYRLGDFYEMFFDDALLASKVLDLTLTGRDCGLPERAPMCGIPYHAADTYISRLIENGYKVAICEQTTQPKKGVKLVEREVLRVVTPGTIIDANLLDETKNNYILSCYLSNGLIGVSYVDISAGIVYLAELSSLSELNDILLRVKPSEILSNNALYEKSYDLASYKLGLIPKFTAYNENSFELKNAHERILNHLNEKSLAKYSFNTSQVVISSLGALLNYLNDTQKRSLTHINQFHYIKNENYMQLDANCRRNLELTETIRDRKKRGSLLWLLDKTQTTMGARTLRNYVEQPLYDIKTINNRLNSVEELIKNIFVKDAIIDEIKNVYDIERLCSRISYGNLSPKDTLALKNSLLVLPKIKKLLENSKTTLLKQVYNNIFDYSAIVNLLHSAINENAPFNLKDGGVIKKGFNKELDELLNISVTGKSFIAQLENTEREKTGIKNLKIGFNNVFGYYIEVLKSQLELVPYNYQRKQTVANAERFITEELKLMEDKILNAQDQIVALEQVLFNKIRQTLLENVVALQTTARSIAELDALLSLAVVAVENNYVKPVVTDKDNKIVIENGRHPVVEKLLKDEEFVPNDTYLDDEDNRTMIITGPNMAGKSTYMRQVAIITLMAHIGSFVPAAKAQVSLTDKIFTRVGASDDLAFGQSTFMVEMVEVSNILEQVTPNSLIILDEVGRGTSTFDGLSIAWSVMEYLAKTQKAKTLFATHYHELTELEGILEGVKNYRINVKEFNNSIIFLRKIVRGGANKSFGIEVAELAGIPNEVIARAREILHSLEENEINKSSTLKTVNDSSTDYKRNRVNQEVVNVLNDINVNSLTPLNAFDLIISLKEKLNK